MAASKIRDDNYYQVSGWMINRLKLKGAALQIYAIIYGFSQDGESSFTGSLQYLCDFTNVSKNTVIKALKDLVELDYIIKTENFINGVQFNTYKINALVVQKLHWGSAETEQGVVQKLNRGSSETAPGGSAETAPNNKSLDNKLDNKSNSKRDKEREETLLMVAELLGKHGYSLFAPHVGELQNALMSFVAFRKDIKKPMTSHAVDLLIEKLKHMTPDVSEQVEIIKQSIMNGWQGIFPLKEKDRPKPQQSNYRKNSNVFLEMLDAEM